MSSGTERHAGRGASGDGSRTATDRRRCGQIHDGSMLPGQACSNRRRGRLMELIAQCGHKPLSAGSAAAPEVSRVVRTTVAVRRNHRRCRGRCHAVDLDTVMTAKPPGRRAAARFSAAVDRGHLRQLKSLEPTVEPIDPVAFPMPLDGQDDDLQVLGVTVSEPCSHTDGRNPRPLQTLEYELTLMQFDTALPPSATRWCAPVTLCVAFTGLQDRDRRFRPVCLRGRIDGSSPRRTFAAVVFASAIPVPAHGHHCVCKAHPALSPEERPIRPTRTARSVDCRDG